MDYRSVLEAIRVTNRYLNRTAGAGDIPSGRVLNALKDLTKLDKKLAEQLDDRQLPIFATSTLSYEETQLMLATINEVSEMRKKRGVYYTPRDVVDFVVASSVNSFYQVSSSETLDPSLAAGIPTSHFIFDLTILDPTCGLGEFVRGAFRSKVNFLKKQSHVISSKEVARVLASISGNDIDPSSTSICRVRIFLDCVEYFGIEIALDLVNEIYNVFTDVDFIKSPTTLNRTFDLIIGNPPYVEDSKYGHLEIKYGNVYCNVISNSISIKHKETVLGLILPLSYAATPRMLPIRTEVASAFRQQTILSFADRPDSLFKQVHQKLCILIAGPGSNRSIRTSSYLYWYKDQRDQVFDKIEICENPHASKTSIPKIGNKTELRIFERVRDDSLINIYENTRSGSHTVSINRRETFWIKVFRGSSENPEFKEFHFKTEEESAFLYCLLSSSLFWWYWITVSDCWHVSRTLNDFRMPKVQNLHSFSELARELESRLEETKVFVGTKQTKYEYKHSECLDIIHKIDSEINRLYDLDELQDRYVKNFALEYRTSRKVKSV